MRVRDTVQDLLPPDPTIQEELSSLGEEALFEMTNLPPARTGINGVLFLSTAVGFHGPRVKFFVKTGKGQPSFSVSISSQPRVLANSLPERVVKQMAPSVIEWVKLNREVLLSFWNEGESWTIDELNDFVGGLKKVSS
jgi:hypothetical protein